MIGFNGSLSFWLERINSAWFVLDACLVFYLAYYLWKSRRDLSLSLFTWWMHPKVPLYIQAALAILVFHTGDMVVRFWVWYLRHQVNRGVSINSTQALITPTIVVFSVMAGWGILCMLRVFSGPWLGRWVWLGGGVVALLAASITHWLPI